VSAALALALTSGLALDGAPIDADGVPPSRLEVWIVFGVLLAFALLLLHREANR
jgi:hypothetical protein